MNRLLAIIFLIFSCNSVLAFQKTVIEKSDVSELIIRISEIHYNRETVEHNGKRYTIFYNDKNTYTGEPGAPQLPAIIKLFALPPNTVPKVEILQQNSMTEHNVLVFPYQGSDPAGNEDIKNLTVNEELYSRNNYFPSVIAGVSVPGDLRGLTIGQLRITPFQYNPQARRLINYTDITIRIYFEKTGQAEEVSGLFKRGELQLDSYKNIINYREIISSLKTGTPSGRRKSISPETRWFDPTKMYFRIAIEKEGIYRLPYNFIENLGWNPEEINPETVQIYNKGLEIPIHVEGENDGIFNTEDYIEFYADWHRGDTSFYDFYTDKNIYWLTWGTKDGKRVEVSNVTYEEGNDADYFIDSVHYEFDYNYFKGLNSSAIHNTEMVDGETWYWVDLTQGYSTTSLLSTSDVVESPEKTARIKVKMKGITSSFNISEANHHIRFILNDNVLDLLEFSGTKDIIYEKTINAGLLNSGVNSFKVESIAVGEDRSKIYIDWIEIIYPRKYVARNDKLKFNLSHNGSKNYSIGNFTSPYLVLYNITENKKLTDFSYGVSGSSKQLNFSLKRNLVPDTLIFFASGSDEIMVPTDVREKDFLNLYDTNNGTDYLIITHDNFLNEAEEFARYRNSRNKFLGGIKVVTVTDIYDEFNYGIENPEVIRDFLKYTTSNWSTAPEYVLLFGDASWDYKGILSGNKNFVPSYGYPSSDNWFVCLGDEGDIIPDMLIGRIPVTSSEEAQNYLAKLREYESSISALWKKSFLTITGGDDPFEQRAFREASGYVNQNYLGVFPVNADTFVVNKTNFEPVDYSHADEIQEIINNGVLVVNSMGHAATGIYDVDFGSPEELRNKGKYPLMMGMSCNTTKFSEPEVTSLSEGYVLIRDKGASAYFGTTGWGLLNLDNSMVKEFFRLIARDSLRCVSEIIKKTKIKLLAEADFTQELVNVINQYTLLGDPAMELELPLKADPAVNSSCITFDKLYPTEQESPLNVGIKVYNYGLNTRDSVKIHIEAEHESGGSKSVFNGLLPPVGLKDSLVIPWDITGRAGKNTVTLTVNPEQAIEEVSEENNNFSKEIFIFGSDVYNLNPLNYAVVHTPSVELQATGSITGNDNSSLYFFEVDTTGEFLKPLFVSKGIQPENFSGTYRITLPSGNRYYYWRVRVFDGADYSRWGNSHFYYDSSAQFDSNWLQTGEGFNNNLLSNVESNERVQLGIENVKLRVESAGFNDGNFCQLLVNEVMIDVTYYDTLVWYEGPGVYIAEIDRNSGSVVKAFKYNCWASGEHTLALVDFIDSVPAGNYVLAGIKDTGPRYKVEEFREAVKTIGSRYVDQLGFRDSWGIIGRKGAEPGSVPEVLSPKGYGRVSVEDSLELFYSTGWIETMPIKIAKEWKQLIIEGEEREDVTNLTGYVIGKNKTKKSYDTLKTVTTPGIINLETIDSKLYGELKLRAELSTDSKTSTPLLRYWGLHYIPAPELVVERNSLTASADSVLEGEEVILSLDVYNIGQSMCDSINVTFYTLDTEGNKTKTGERIITGIAENECKTAELLLNTKGYSGDVYLNAEVNSGEEYPELFSLNNVAITQLYVKSDTVKPSIQVLFDGREILQNDYVSTEPEITATIRDNSPLGFTDTSQVTVYLNNNKVSYDSEDVLEFIPLNDGEIRGEVIYMPKLSRGLYNLEIEAEDQKGNVSVYTIDFKVEENLLIKDAFNFPNPFNRETKFTFMLTQPADDLYIKIYTVNGRMIRNIFVGPSVAGFNTCDWDGRDEDGDRIANGTYIYRIIAKKDNHTAIVQNKLVVMK